MSTRHSVQISAKSWTMLNVIKLVTGKNITTLIDDLVIEKIKGLPTAMAIFNSTLVGEKIGLNPQPSKEYLRKHHDNKECRSVG